MSHHQRPKISTHVEDELFDAIARAAKEDGRSISSFVARVLEAWAQAHCPEYREECKQRSNRDL